MVGADPNFGKHFISEKDPHITTKNCMVLKRRLSLFPATYSAAIWEIGDILI